MNILASIRRGETGILAAGNHPKILQSILDFDFLSGKKEPSVAAIITANRKAQKFFFGSREILVPCFKDMGSVPPYIAPKIRFLLNLQSGRRAFESTMTFFEIFPRSLGAHIFAENVPEAHAAELIRKWNGKKFIAGPSGVGLFVSGHLKLGAIGGIDAQNGAAGGCYVGILNNDALKRRVMLGEMLHVDSIILQQS